MADNLSHGAPTVTRLRWLYDPMQWTPRQARTGIPGNANMSFAASFQNGIPMIYSGCTPNLIYRQAILRLTGSCLGAAPYVADAAQSGR